MVCQGRSLSTWRNPAFSRLTMSDVLTLKRWTFACLSSPLTSWTMKGARFFMISFDNCACWSKSRRTCGFVRSWSIALPMFMSFTISIFPLRREYHIIFLAPEGPHPIPFGLRSCYQIHKRQNHIQYTARTELYKERHGRWPCLLRSWTTFPAAREQLAAREHSAALVGRSRRARRHSPPASPPHSRTNLNLFASPLQVGMRVKTPPVASREQAR